MMGTSSLYSVQKGDGIWCKTCESSPCVDEYDKRLSFFRGETSPATTFVEGPLQKEENKYI